LKNRIEEWLFPRAPRVAAFMSFLLWPQGGAVRKSFVFLSRPGTIGRQAVKVARLSFLTFCIIAVFMPASLHAVRHPVIISGGVTTNSGRPLADAFVCIPALNVSAVTDNQGMYRLVIGSSVHPGQQVVINASRQGFDYSSYAVTLAPGTKLKQSFRLEPLK